MTNNFMRFCAHGAFTPLFALVLTSSAAAQSMSSTEAQTLQTAQQALQAKEYQRVIDELAPLRERYPREGDIPRLMAHAYNELGQPAEARKAAMEALAVGRITPDLLSVLARIDQARDDQLSLVNTVRLLTVFDAHNDVWRLLHGDLLAGHKDFEESAATYRQLLDSKPESASAYMRLGQVEVELDRKREAAAHLEIAWQLGEANKRLPLMLATVWQQLGDNRQALAWTERGLGLGEIPDDTLKLAIAGIYWELREFDKAKKQAEELTKSTDVKVKGQAYVLLGRLAAREEKIDEAVEFWRKAVEQGNVDDQQLLTLLGAYFFNKGEYPKAAEFLERAVRVESKANAEQLRFLILSYIRSNSPDSAKKYLSRYIEFYSLDENAKNLVRSIASSTAP